MSGGVGFGNFTYAPEATSAARNADFYVLEKADDGVTQIVAANSSITVSPAGGTGVVTLSVPGAGVSQIVAGNSSITVSPAGGTGAVTLTVPPPIFPPSGFVTGMIMLWGGVTPPDGWLICNGQPGTPDLRDRFIVSCGTTYLAGDTGGASSITVGLGNLPTLQSPFTVFTGAGTIGSATLGQGGGDAQGSSNFTVTGTGANTAITTLPPYYALYYIQKI
jgi:hypothetical protein